MKLGEEGGSCNNNDSSLRSNGVTTATTTHRRHYHIYHDTIPYYTIPYRTPPSSIPLPFPRPRRKVPPVCARQTSRQAGRQVGVITEIRCSIYCCGARRDGWMDGDVSGRKYAILEIGPNQHM